MEATSRRAILSYASHHHSRACGDGCVENAVSLLVSLSLSVAPKVLAVVTYMDMALHGCLRRALATVAT